MVNSGTFKSNEKHRLWKGDGASRKAFHSWLHRNFGPAKKCERCVKTAKRYEWANIKNHNYSHKREDYIQLCPSCHRLMDYGNKCRKGHEFTSESTYIRPTTGHKTCKICRDIVFKQWYQLHRGVKK